MNNRISNGNAMNDIGMASRGWIFQQQQQKKTAIHLMDFFSFFDSLYSDQHILFVFKNLISNKIYTKMSFNERHRINHLSDVK